MSEGQEQTWQDPEIRSRRLAGMKTNPRGKDKSKRKSRKKEYKYVCDGCGKAFTTSRKRTGKRKFHNARCRNDWQSRQKKGKTVECANPNCTTKVYRKPSRLDRKYCSMACAKSDPGYWKDVADTKKKNAHRDWPWYGWREKRTERRYWDPIAASVRERDGHTCQGCGVKWKRRIDGRSKPRFAVHHIIPRRKGGPDEPWNLITLCPKCHRETDAQGGPVRYPHQYQTRIGEF